MLSAWFADRVSARLSHVARVLLAAALGETRGLAQSGEALEELSTSPLPGAIAGESDPLSVLTKIELANALLKLDEPEEATALLRPIVPGRRAMPLPCRARPCSSAPGA